MSSDTNAQNLQKVLDKLLDDVHNGDPDTETFNAQLQAIDTLFKCKETNAKAKASLRWFSGDALASVGASLAGIVMISQYEKTAVLTTKALDIIKKML